MIKNYFIEVNKERYDNSIIPKMYNILDNITNKLKLSPNQILYLGLFGSQNYKMNTPNSDIDCFCIILPFKENFSLNFNFLHISLKNQYNGICNIRNIQEIFNYILNGNISVYDIFLTPYALVNKNYKDILENFYLSDIRYITTLNHISLMKANEIKLNQYYKKNIRVNIKSFIGAIRVKDILDQMLLDINYADVWMPSNWEELLKKKYEGKIDVIEFENFNQLKKQQIPLLQEYYKTHQNQFTNDIKDILNSYLNKIITRYFELQME